MSKHTSLTFPTPLRLTVGLSPNLLQHDYAHFSDFISALLPTDSAQGTLTVAEAARHFVEVSSPAFIDSFANFVTSDHQNSSIDDLKNLRLKYGPGIESLVGLGDDDDDDDDMEKAMNEAILYVGLIDKQGRHLRPMDNIVHLVSLDEKVTIQAYRQGWPSQSAHKIRRIQRVDTVESAASNPTIDIVDRLTNPLVEHSSPEVRKAMKVERNEQKPPKGSKISGYRNGKRKNAAIVRKDENTSRSHTLIKQPIPPQPSSREEKVNVADIMSKKSAKILHHGNDQQREVKANITGTRSLNVQSTQKRLRTLPRYDGVQHHKDKLVDTVLPKKSGEKGVFMSLTSRETFESKHQSKISNNKQRLLRNAPFLNVNRNDKNKFLPPTIPYDCLNSNFFQSIQVVDKENIDKSLVCKPISASRRIPSPSLLWLKESCRARGLSIGSRDEMITKLSAIEDIFSAKVSLRALKAAGNASKSVTDQTRPTKSELQRMCAVKGLPVTGTKADLRNRILAGIDIDIEESDDESDSNTMNAALSVASLLSKVTPKTPVNSESLTVDVNKKTRSQTKLASKEIKRVSLPSSHTSNSISGGMLAGIFGVPT